MKMKTLGILLAAITCGAALRAETIGTAEAFVAKLTANPAGTYKLSADIDLTDAGYKTIAKFSGILDGRGHTIRGLGKKPLFTENTGSVVSLTLDGRCGSEGTNTLYTMSADGGCLATTSTGAYYADCRIVGYDVKVSSNKLKVGIFSAYAYDGTHFVRCETDASCTVTQNGEQVHIGGLVGCIKRKDGVTTNVASFVDCTNRATIVRNKAQGDSFGTGGFVGVFADIWAAQEPYPEVNFIRCVNLGNISASATKGAMGGIVGFCNGINKTANMTAIMRFLYCENRGNLTSSGNNVLSDGLGGILGATRGAYDCIFIGCVNYGEISANGLRSDANNPNSGLGGLVGLASRENLSKVSDLEGWRFENCANYGNLTLSNAGHIGGICGYNVAVASNNRKGKFAYENCANYGTITSSVDSGAIVGEINIGSGDGSLAVLSNCWALAGSPYTNCTATTLATANFFAADAENYDASNALTALNAMAATDNEYLPWTMGTDDAAKPELTLFSSVALSDDIPVLFYDYDGTLLQSSTVEAGGSVTPPAKPSRSGWYFVDWSGTYKNVTSTSIVFADWTRIKKQTGFRLVIR